MRSWDSRGDCLGCVHKPRSPRNGGAVAPFTFGFERVHRLLCTLSKAATSAICLTPVDKLGKRRLALTYTTQYFHSSEPCDTKPAVHQSITKQNRYIFHCNKEIIPTSFIGIIGISTPVVDLHRTYGPAVSSRPLSSCGRLWPARKGVRRAPAIPGLLLEILPRASIRIEAIALLSRLWIGLSYESFLSAAGLLRLNHLSLRKLLERIIHVLARPTNIAITLCDSLQYLALLHLLRLHAFLVLIPPLLPTILHTQLSPCPILLPQQSGQTQRCGVLPMTGAAGYGCRSLLKSLNGGGDLIPLPRVPPMHCLLCTVTPGLL